MTLPRPLPSKNEKKLSLREQQILENARQGKRDPETMAGWTFRIGMHGFSGRRAYQVKPWGSDHWFWVEWCPSTLQQVAQVPVEKVATGFDRL